MNELYSKTTQAHWLGTTEVVGSNPRRGDFCTGVFFKVGTRTMTK